MLIADAYKSREEEEAKMKNLLDVMKKNTDLQAAQVTRKKVYSNLLFDVDESSSDTGSNPSGRNKPPKSKKSKIGFGQFIAQKMAFQAVQKTWSELKKQINFDKEIAIKLREDIGFDIITGFKIRQRTLNLFKDDILEKGTSKIRRLKQRLNKDDASMRMPADYKDLKKMVMQLDFFNKPRNGEQYGEEEAMELVRHIKLKYFPPKKHIFFPE